MNKKHKNAIYFLLLKKLLKYWKVKQMRGKTLIGQVKKNIFMAIKDCDFGGASQTEGED